MLWGIMLVLTCPFFCCICRMWTVSCIHYFAHRSSSSSATENTAQITNDISSRPQIGMLADVYSYFPFESPSC